MKYGEKIVLPTDLAVEKDGERFEVSTKNLPVHPTIFQVKREQQKTFRNSQKNCGNLH